MELANMETPATATRPDRLQPAPGLMLMHVRQSPHAHHLTQEVIAWMDSYALLSDREKRDRVLNMDIGVYAGYSYPSGSHANVLVHAKYIVLWLLWDDFVVEKGGSASEALYKVLSLREAPASADTYMCAWWDLASDLRRRGSSPNAVERFARSMRAWFEAAVLERESARPTGLKNFDDCFNRRLETIGMVPTAAELEICTGIVVPDSKQTRAILRDTCVIVGISNELVSHAKDHDWINLINVYSQTHGCSIDDARNQLVEIHNRAVLSLDDKVNRSGGKVRAWGEMLQFCAEGFSYWHTVASRYAGSRIMTTIVNPLDSAQRRAASSALRSEPGMGSPV
ncbi:MAG TPA: terpene synthase family protein [Pararobbsia sp.]|nr:terpene synthase family protein [Pararobbsia sp.]